MSEDLHHLMPSMSQHYDGELDTDVFQRRRQEDSNLPDEVKGDTRDGSRRRRMGRDETEENPSVRHLNVLTQNRARYRSQEDIFGDSGETTPPPRPNLPVGYSPRVRPQLTDTEASDIESSSRQYRDALRRFSRSRSNSANIEQIVGPMRVQWQEQPPVRTRSRSGTCDQSPNLSLALEKPRRRSHEDSTSQVDTPRRRASQEDSGSQRHRPFRDLEAESST